MPQRAERAVLVVGVGRSGTSLAMQALERLGAGLSQALVPASEHNPRGAFEDLAVRDRMAALGRHFGHFSGQLRPEGWREDALAVETGQWLAGHLRSLAEGCERPVFAVKFPLASVYLPLWYEAFGGAGLPFALVWATRNAGDTLASLRRAYDFDAGTAENRYLLRSFHLLEDLRAEALLLPYEGWAEAPQAQLRALAEHAGLPTGEAAPDDLFDPAISHRGGGAGLVPLVRSVDEAIAGRRGRAEALFGPDLAPLRGLAREIATAFAEGRVPPVSGKAQAPQDPLASKRRLDEARAAARAEAERRKAAEAELTTLKRAYAALTRARDAETMAAKDALADRDGEILKLREQLRALADRAKLAETLARKKAGWARRNEAARKSAEAEAMLVRRSVRWRAGDMLVRAWQKPRWRDLALPFRLVGLASRSAQAKPARKPRARPKVRAAS